MMIHLNRVTKSVYLLFGFIFGFTPSVLADTIHFKNGGILKGFVVKEYHDRILISTSHGEKEVLNAIISKIDYDDPLRQKLQVGRNFEESGNLAAAKLCYEEILRMNPDHSAARERLIRIREQILRQDSSPGRHFVMNRDQWVQWSQKVNVSEESLLKYKKEKLQESLGISVEERSDGFRVVHIRNYSPAYEGGIMVDDSILKINGNEIKYMDLESVYDLLLGKKYSELKLTVSRLLHVPKGDSRRPLGVFLSIGDAGLEVAKIPGQAKYEIMPSLLMEGDIIVKINNDATRYMSYEEALLRISKNDSDQIDIMINRTYTLWRE